MLLPKPDQNLPELAQRAIYALRMSGVSLQIMVKELDTGGIHLSLWPAIVDPTDPKYRKTLIMSETGARSELYTSWGVLFLRHDGYTCEGTIETFSSHEHSKVQFWHVPPLV